MIYTLNGEESLADRVTYEEIAEVAGYSPETAPTVTYRNGGPDGCQEGILSSGQQLIVNEKTIVNCIDTGNA